MALRKQGLTIRRKTLTRTERRVKERGLRIPNRAVTTHLFYPVNIPAMAGPEGSFLEFDGESWLRGGDRRDLVVRATKVVAFKGLQ